MSNPLDQPSAPSPQPSTPVPETSDARAEPLSIEGPPAHGQGSEEPVEAEAEIHTLDLGEGNVVKLDKLGPMIINSDGTLSRIQNWQDLHPIEQERTVRLLVKKRNLVRLQKLDQENKATGGDDGEEKLSALQASSGGEA
ncbi:hypothetical protein IAU60_001264 [Kwoniella sp. DSM 27419]